MTFAVHTEKLNLISIVAAEHHDEIHDAKVSQRRQQQQQQQQQHPQYSASTNERKHDDIGTVNPHFNVRSFESRMYEMTSLFQLAVPTFIIQLGAIIPGFTVASYIGRKYSTDIVYLDGYTLASLTVNLFTLSLLQGLNTASDTLSPQAYGAGNMKEVGYLAVRGFFASMIVVLPITILLIFYMKPMLLWIGEDSDSVTHACAWFQVYACAIPFNALYQVTTKFLSAQNQMQPLVRCCLLSTCIVLPISLYTMGSSYGYIGTAIAIAIYQVFQSTSLIIYLWILQPHDPSTWPGLCDSIQNAILLKPFLSYMVRRFFRDPNSPIIIDFIYLEDGTPRILLTSLSFFQ
jgi:Na+-driven multidrug efflux pump